MHPGVKQDGSVNGATWPNCVEQINSACSMQTEIIALNMNSTLTSFVNVDRENMKYDRITTAW